MISSESLKNQQWGNGDVLDSVTEVLLESSPSTAILWNNPCSLLDQLLTGCWLQI